MADEFFEEEGRLLTPHAFEFVLDGEMKRAVRSQNYLTLVVLETRREWDGMTMTADDGLVDEVARIVGHEVRDTDLLGNTEIGVLSLVLLDADYDNCTKVIGRLVSHACGRRRLAEEPGDGPSRRELAGRLAGIIAHPPLSTHERPAISALPDRPLGTAGPSLLRTSRGLLTPLHTLQDRPSGAGCGSSSGEQTASNYPVPPAGPGGGALSALIDASRRT